MDSLNAFTGVVRRCVDDYGMISPGDRIAVGVDARDGYVAVNGWKEVTPEPGVAFCRRCAEAGVKAVIATDISRDGTLQGTNLDLYRELLTISGLRRSFSNFSNTSTG